MKKITSIAIILILLVGCLWAQGAEEKGVGAGELTNVTIQLDGGATPYYSPLYLAELKGFFEEEGLDVEFYYAAASDIIKNVAAGNVEFGFPNADAVVTACSNGIPVKIVHNTYQHGLGSTIFKADSDIKTAIDLKGKKVAVTSLGSPNYIQLQVLLKSVGLTLDDIELEVIGTGAILNALTTGQVDAIVFSMLRTIELNNAGANVAEIRSDTVLPSFGNVLIASDAYTENHPEVIDAFSKALTKSIEYICDGNADEAVDLSVENYVKTFQAAKRDITIQIINEVFETYLWQSDFTKENGIGTANPVSWNKLINTQKEYGIIEKAFDAKDILYSKIIK
ncbi:MAG: ABC transporter substrate-binding protein [Sphaerochaetaceae bacterium]|nr:ABC transporter substrate-binding protein [Sphaerochaetaceae bacterium]